MKLLLIDNYDSFTYNLVQIFEDLGVQEMSIVKNDKVNLSDVSLYDKIVFSPGPGTPYESPVLFKILEEYRESKTILGICLGHQAIASYFGAKLINHDKVFHGLQRKIKIMANDSIFENIRDNFNAGLYHSWAVSEDRFPQCLNITAKSEDGIIMALSHADYDIKGLQFHPESHMTGQGRKLLANWLKKP